MKIKSLESFWKTGGGKSQKKIAKHYGDQLLNDRLVTYIERDLFFFFQVSDGDVINRFQSIKGRRMPL